MIKTKSPMPVIKRIFLTFFIFRAVNIFPGRLSRPNAAAVRFKPSQASGWIRRIQGFDTAWPEKRSGLFCVVGINFFIHRAAQENHFLPRVDALAFAHQIQSVHAAHRVIRHDHDRLGRRIFRQRLLRIAETSAPCSQAVAGSTPPNPAASARRPPRKLWPTNRQRDQTW